VLHCRKETVMMLNVTLVPSLSHCIETTAKKEYSDTLKQVFTGNIDGNSQKLELLKNFLETADFKKLRAESEVYMAKGDHVQFLLYTENGLPKFEMQVRQNQEKVPG